MVWCCDVSLANNFTKKSTRRTHHDLDHLDNLDNLDHLDHLGHLDHLDHLIRRCEVPGI